MLLLITLFHFYAFYFKSNAKNVFFGDQIQSSDVKIPF